MALSILCVTRSFRLKPEPNLGVIMDPPKIIDLEEFKVFLKVAIKPWMKASMSCDWEQFHYSTKSGPNGQAMYTSFDDFHLLDDDLIKALQVFGGSELCDMITKITSFDDVISSTPLDYIRARYKPKKSKECIRRLSFISDREGKTRTIGVLDYFSQTALKPLHDSVMRILGKLKCDMTFRQDAGPLSAQGPFFSIDLKAATDSFPISLQEAVLCELIGEEKTRAWKTIMVGYPFLNPSGSPVMYKRGQPMGAYSS
jgi:hypothetical protein